jgi:hypothetical protein
MPYLILGLALVIGLALLARGIAGTDPKLVVRVLKWTLGGLGLALFGFLLVTGRFYALAEYFIFALPAALFWRRIAHGLKGLRGPSPGQSSDIETRYLRMALDHDTGQLRGTVLEGRFQGRLVEDLSQAELLDLLHECRIEDPESAPILETYLDRTFGAEWRDAEAGAAGGGGAGPSASGRMTPEEAYEILGLNPGAKPEEIKEAHHRLMLKLHPDQGGSTYLAAKINQAKDVLLAG